MGKKRSKNVADLVKPGNGVRLHLPNGKSKFFSTVAKAQKQQNGFLTLSGNI